MLIKISLILSFCGMLLLGPHITAEVADAGEKNRSPGHAVMVVVDQISWNDITNADLPVLKKLMINGAAGLMTTNSGGLRTPENTYSTIGAGAKISGGEAAGFGFNSMEKYEDDTAQVSYYRRMGINAKEKVLQLGIAQMETVNKGLKYDYLQGALGTILHRHGLKTGVIGNADLTGWQDIDKYRRYAVNIAMDRNGLVDYGNVSSLCNKHDPDALGGVSTDYRLLLDEYRLIKNKAAFVVIETGDLSRIGKLSNVASLEAVAKQKQKSLQRLDLFLGKVLKEVDLNNDLLMIVVPGPSNQSMEIGDFLTPFIMAGRDVNSGVIWSGTTKRKGLISNTDIAPTVLGFFGLSPVVTGGGGQKKDIVLNGQIIDTINSINSFNEITELGRKTLFMHNARYPFVKTYINICLGAVAAAIMAVKLDVRAGIIIKPVLLAVTFMPAVFLLADFMTDFSLFSAGLKMIILTVILTFISMTAGRIKRFSPFLISSGLTTAMLIADVFTGGSLIKTSPLSYDATAGARYYGIGNEYMGVLIGAAVAFTGLLLDRLREFVSALFRLLAALLFVIVIYTISAPNMGTNAGGAIAAIACLGTAGMMIFGARVSWKTALTVTASAATVLSLFILFDLTRAVETQSHMGRTIGLIKENGLSEILDIIIRKAEVNFKLIKYTTWSWFFGIGLTTVLFMHKLFPGEAQQYEKENPWFSRMIPGIAVGSIAALVFNDSGVVAAATLLSFGTPPVIWEIIRIREKAT